MAFKNACKILISQFRLCWKMILYMIIIMVIIGSMSIAFVLPIVREVTAAGINDIFNNIFKSIINGTTLSDLGTSLNLLADEIKNLFNTNRSFSVNVSLLISLVFILINRFILGLYEIPMLKVLEGSMSSNAKLRFTGNFISNIGNSCRFVLVKMIYTILFDIIIAIIMIAMASLFKYKAMVLFTPFLMMLILIILLSLRYTFIAMWAPSIILGGKKVFSGLAFSVQKGCRHFKTTFATYAISWVLIIPMNLFIGIFTFGAGLLFSIPISMIFMLILTMTIYYGKNNKRYYVDNTVVNPPEITD